MNVLIEFYVNLFQRVKSIDNYTEDEIRMVSDEINSLPRKRLSYHTPEEMFEKELDKIYASISTNI